MLQRDKVCNVLAGNPNKKQLLNETENCQTSINANYNQQEVEKYIQSIKPTGNIQHDEVIKTPPNSSRSQLKLCLKPSHEIHKRNKFKFIIQNADVLETITDGKN